MTLDRFRRAAGKAVGALTLGLFLLAGATGARADELRIGYQKYGTLVVLKARKSLEARLAPLGVEVKWTEFPAGPQLLEALNVGAVDLGTVGEAPPIFAQAAGADFVYLSNEPAAPSGEALIVPDGSPLHNLADLKGKKIALNKGSNVHYLLLKVLEKAGVAYSDIQPVYLAPADARAAFERGSVDAWAIWDPFLAAAEGQLHARRLVDGTGLVKNHQFYLATRSYAQKHAEILQIVQEELKKVDTWGNANPKDVAELLAPQIGLPAPILEVAAQRAGYGVTPVSDEVLAEQQKIADAFVQIHLIPQPIVVTQATLGPRTAAR